MLFVGSLFTAQHLPMDTGNIWGSKVRVSETSRWQSLYTNKAREPLGHCCKHILLYVVKPHRPNWCRPRGLNVQPAQELQTRVQQ